MRFMAVLAATMLWLVAAIPVSAADTLTPSPVTTTLVAGTSTTVNKTLTLDGVPAKADIIVAIDTTASMGIPIAQAQADAMNICSNVKSSIPGARFAVVALGDYPAMPSGGPGDVPYALLTPGFVSSCTVFSAAIATMTAHDGGDLPEAYNRTFFEAYSDSAYSAPVALGGRDPLASQFLVVLGDATPHSAVGFGSCVDAPPDDFGRDGAPGGGDDITSAAAIAGLVANNVSLLMIRYTTGGVSVALSCYNDLATATGGAAVDDSGAGTIGPFIVSNAKLVPYSADLVVSAGCPISFSFNPTFPTGMLTGPQNDPVCRDDHGTNDRWRLHLHDHRGHGPGRHDRCGRDGQRDRHAGCSGHARPPAKHSDQRRRRAALRDRNGQGCIRQCDAGNHRRLLGEPDDLPHASEWYRGHGFDRPGRVLLHLGVAGE